MSSTALSGGGRGASGFLHRDRSIAGVGFSRWMVPPAALCVHLCIGQAYAFSVFNLPMTKLIGIARADGFEVFTRPERIGAREVQHVA